MEVVPATEDPVPVVANVPAVVGAGTAVVTATVGPVPAVAAVPDTDGPVPAAVVVPATRIVYEILLYE
jgi:hypothetical protein